MQCVERSGMALIGVLAAAMLWVSWRRWPDPLIDFGRELYLPWRLANGAVLYRDLDHLFGPLSQYFHALVFSLAGPGLMHLVYVNLAICACILAMAYALVRIAWGALAAFCSCCVVVCTLSFCQITLTSNYNYVCPYAYETTHGIALLLGTTLAFVMWFRRFAWRWLVMAGLGVGMTALTKVEILFAALCVAGTGCVLALAQDRRRWRSILMLPCIAIVPVFAATLAFAACAEVRLPQAWAMANNAWMYPIAHPEMVSLKAVQGFLGTDNPAGNAVGILIWSSGAALFIAGLLWIARRMGKIEAPGLRWLGTGLVALLCSGIAMAVEWPAVGRVLPAAMAAIALPGLLHAWRNRTTALLSPSAVCGVLLWVLGCAMLARMPLNPRIYHYGYYQAFPAMLVTVAGVVALFPRRFLQQPAARTIYVAAVVCVLAVMSGQIAVLSAQRLLLKTQPVGEGADRFYTFAASVHPNGALVEASRKRIQQTPGTQSLLVIPEGVMLNYLTRLPGTTACYVPYLPLAFGQSEQFAAQIAAASPSHILLISRDLREYGITRLGDSDAEGRSLFSELRRQYRKLDQLGDNPLEAGRYGSVLLERRNLNAAAVPTSFPTRP